MADQPPLPEELKYIWAYYNELQNAEPLTFSEIKAWSELTARNISAQEVIILKSLDNIFRNVLNEQRDGQSSN